MLKQIEGSHAVAEAVALCRPQVICAYPITPQTHIVEDLSAIVKSGKLEGCEYINVESEFAALSVAIGSCAAGARSYTATSSQGLLFMIEAVYNASGLRMPIVMTLGNRAIGAPINIWNDHGDAMAVRDSGWLMLFAETNQEAVDLHIQAFKIAEATHCPVMVCVDGFILTHAYERVDIPSQEEVDSFLPPYIPNQVLDVDDPYTIGALVGPEAFTEVRYIHHKSFNKALEVIPNVSKEFEDKFGRKSGGLVREYKTEDAEVVVVSMGSACGTIKDVIDDMRESGDKIGNLSICSFRPFPVKALNDVLSRPSVKQVVVVEKAFELGLDGIVSKEIRSFLHGVNISSVVAGLGGRQITKKSLKNLFGNAMKSDLDKMIFLDLDCSICKDKK